MATTTNFGWETPDDTDLVKDGALAIRTLGSAIDTSLVDLKGGTTGQVLSKTSNTDMDFTWVTSDDANAIQNAIVDAKGDLIAASAADTPARLAVGNNGETLVADSSASVGLRYQEPKAGNPVINSAFQVWQRGTSISVTGSNTYTADRWTSTAGASANMTISRQTTSDTTNLPNIQYCARVQRNSGQTGTGGQFFYQNFESINSIPFAGKTITFSFYARRGADYSGASNDLKVRLFTGTGTDQNVLVGFTGSVTLISSTAALTTTWQRFSYTGTIATTATQIALGFEYNGVGTAGTNDYFEVTGVQLDIGSVALPFRTYSATLAGELAACRRYLPMISATSTEVATGYSYSTNNAIYQFYFDVPARVAPTGITLSGNFYGYALNTTYAITPVFNGSSQYGATLVSGSGLTITAGQGSRLATNGTATILFTGCEL